MILTIIQFGQIKHIKKNTLIIEEKQKNENIFFLLQGIAYNYCLFENDSKRILNIENQEHFLKMFNFFRDYHDKLGYVAHYSIKA